MKEFSFLMGNCPGALVEIAAELKKEHRIRYLELVEAENLLMLGLEEMF